MKSNPNYIFTRKYEEELHKKYEKLIKPTLKANLAHMYDLIDNPEIQSIIKDARDSLKVPQNGRNPNTSKAYRKEINRLAEKHRSNLLPLLLYTTTLGERNTLQEYVEKIMFGFDVFENFKESIELYIIHNIITAPEHNVGLHSKIYGDGRSHLPEIHFFRAPYVNDWKIAKILLERHIRSLPDKFKKSYRGKRNLDKDVKIAKQAFNRKRFSANATGFDKPYDITNYEIAQDILGKRGKEETVKKKLSRHRKRVQELTSRPRWTVRKQ